MKKLLLEKAKSSTGLILSGNSETIPDKSYSIRELVFRFSRNMAVELNQKQSEFDDSDDYENVQHYVDITELEQQIALTKGALKKLNENKLELNNQLKQFHYGKNSKDNPDVNPGNS